MVFHVQDKEITIQTASMTDFFELDVVKVGIFIFRIKFLMKYIYYVVIVIFIIVATKSGRNDELNI